ncbi:MULTISPECIES: efflux RND transporter periplasmic adaptor subunit [Acidobacterium]|nr:MULTISPECIES: efflux RND transporter periplasmic adaptor subunit [Acidobacterium]HCT59854.1 efflux RND transporter periplasmic adaptor subunit [Acidobacterium sp.]
MALPIHAQSTGTITAQRVSSTPHLRAYAQVVPISTLPLNAAETGTLAGLTITPGTHVHTGQVLATLRGPEIDSLLLELQASLRSAKAQLRNAEKALSIQREQLRAHLSTRQSLHQAMSAEASAQAALETIQSRLHATRQMAQITAPSDALVLSLQAASGERVSAGQPIVTLQPSSALWLRASFYGGNTAQIHPGMTGLFTPASGGKPIAVRVRAISGVTNPSGSEYVMMTAANASSPWQNGQYGTVTLNLPAAQVIAVPTRALILSQGSWWVMVHTAQGDQPRKVIPGSARGWTTSILSGLKPGEQVVVQNAYLLFQSKTAGQYQIPD